HDLRKQVLEAVTAVSACEKMGNLSHTLPSKCCSYTQAMQKQLGLTAVFHGSKAGWIKFPLPN
ncbi:hypothetical protein GOGPGP_GOGPGP_15935, partial [Dysosmobacter welbionis]